MTTAVRFRGVSRHFGSIRAVDRVTLDVASGEFFAMLGPSGSGKTTCLRLIAGFETPTEGEIEIFGQPSSRIPPYRRPVNTVFQDYALFPHLNVIDNVAYGLMVAGKGRSERHKRRTILRRCPSADLTHHTACIGHERIATKAGAPATVPDVTTPS